MFITLNKIKEKYPCSDGWKKLLKNLGKAKADDDELSLITILDSNGIKDAIWSLRCLNYKDYCLFLADIADSVLHIFEEKHPEDKRPRLAIQAIRDYKSNGISIDKLHKARAAAYDAAYDAADAAAYAATYAAYDAADVADDAAAYAAADAADADARRLKWGEIESLFIKHFGESNAK